MFGLPVDIFNWLISFLTGRVQYCKVNDALCTPRNISLSILSIGPGLGLSLYVVMECDIQPQSQQNILIKYADNTNILVPERTDCQSDEEFGQPH